jgi:VCBS repeat-containing protein
MAGTSHRRLPKSRRLRSRRRPVVEALERRDLLATFTTLEDTVLTVADAGLAGAVIQSRPLHGSLELNNTGGFAYKPAPNYYGPDRFTYFVVTTTPTNAVSAPGALSEVALVVSPVNDAPEARGDEYHAYRNTPLSIEKPGVLKNDKDVDNQELTAQIVQQAAHGTVVLEANGSFKYTPAENYSGPDSFTYRASDGVAASGVARVSILVKTLPDARDDNYTVSQNSVLTVPPKGVLANDLGVGDRALTASLETGEERGPKHGTVVLKADGSFVYTPAPNYVGPDSFIYRATDVGDATSPPPAFDLAKVSIYVSPVIAAVVANNDAFTTLMDKPLEVPSPGVLRNDSVLFASPTLAALDGVPGTPPNNLPNFPLTATLVTGPANGTLELRPTGGFWYKPKPGYVGTDTFTYSASIATTAASGTSATDPKIISAVATVTIYIQPTQPTVHAFDDVYRTAINQPLTVSVPGVLGNDRAFAPPILEPNSPLASGSGKGESPVKLVLSAELIEPRPVGLTFNSDGSFKYEPAKDFSGLVTFTYRAKASIQNADGTLTAAPAAANIVCQTQTAGGAILPCSELPDDIATVTIHVKQPDAPPGPIARDDSYLTAQNKPLEVRKPGVLANDSPGRWEPVPVPAIGSNVLPFPGLTVMLVGDGPKNGTVALNLDGSFVYTPKENFIGLDTFTYQIKRELPADPAPNPTLVPEAPSVLSNIATVTIRVVAAVAHGDVYSTLKDTPLTIPDKGVLANDEGGSAANPLVATLIPESGPEHGTLTLNPGGGFVYTPKAGYVGPDMFAYRATSGVDPAPQPAAGQAAAGGTGTERPAPTAPDVAIVKLYVRPSLPSSVQAHPDRYVTPKNTTLEIAKPGVLANDYALVNHRVTASLGDQPLHGTVIVNADGSFSYTPKTDFVGEDKFTYRATDADAPAGTSPGTATVVIHVLADQTLPKFITGGDQRTTDESGEQKVIDWATLVSISGAAKPTFVVATDNPRLFAVPPTIDTAGQLIYKPAPNVSGRAQVSVTLRDGSAADASPPATFQIQVDKPRPYYNAANSRDVTNDNSVSPIDAVIVINYLNAHGGGPLEQAAGESAASGPASWNYYDVNGDGHVSPIDAVLVINDLNAAGPTSPSGGEGEGEGTLSANRLLPATDTSSAFADTIALLAQDAADELQRRRRANG